MNTTFEQIQNKLEVLEKKKYTDKEQTFVQHYLGTGKKVLGIKISEILKIAKDTINDQDKTSVKDIVDLLDKLFFANTFEEHAIGGKIFTLLKPEAREQISFSHLEKWLEKARGWVEIDVICQSTFTGEEVIKRWPEWGRMIKRFRKSKIISLRRASLVLQNPSVKKTNDTKMRKLAFETIDELKGEKDILITKAVSWLLRSLVALDREEVKKYLVENQSSLPRIAFRETMKKIETGKKTGKKEL